MEQICGIFYQCEEYTYMLHIILLRAHFSQNEKCCYEIRDLLVPFFTHCEELVPIFHGRKFAKCEICGSTKVAISGLNYYDSDKQYHLTF